MDFANTSTVPAYLWDKDPDLDDALHNPDPVRDAKLDRSFTFFSSRGWLNVSALVILVAGLVTLFAGYPIIDYYARADPDNGGYNLGGINGSGQVPDLPGLPSLIDSDTPQSAYTRTGFDGKKYNLVFSDEFELDGRTFYPGEDPYWEAMDFHYWPTGDLEWYDPSAATTKDGKLVLTMTMEDTHDLNWKSAMLQGWNKLCFTTGYVEVSVSFPGAHDTAGFWPGVWTMGNLGRAGYGASTQGMWPYSYDTCDVGTFPNQMTADNEPANAANGNSNGDGPVSELPGQRTSACTCPGGDHPGPKNSVGRAAPEIDILEHQIETQQWQGQVSQSFQVAPFDYQYKINNNSDTYTFYDDSITEFNSYRGSSLQQAVSALTFVDKNDYGGQQYGVFGVEYWSDPNDRSAGYIEWVTDGKPSWRVNADAIGPNDEVEIGQRIIPEEPMYMVLNFGMAYNFQPQDYSKLTWPNNMYIDYVRIYQREGLKKKDYLSCDPEAHPTKDYIESHIKAYSDPNVTTWDAAGFTFPRNRLYDGC
ncbi:glycoside hydrolase family 16 protein [Cylindrobasidium torrendii FP15055 ss-10]|uniref:Glycoside hydrolase family 16 protein n=1 Tax=Cylindrobasidium torrendii FP15055 ss-10 TaxID=1314674 RepID=A0A0D7BNH9_9AGAR|nr:glycoside hydrolase family 16 protein [Cylindrobasidium torrendii FP15055 ss-10]